MTNKHLYQASKPLATTIPVQDTAGSPEILSVSASASDKKHSPLDSKFPVFMPPDEGLFLSQEEFSTLLKKLTNKPQANEVRGLHVSPKDRTHHDMPSLKRASQEDIGEEPPKKAPFVQALETHADHVRTEQDLAKDNVMLTENSDPAFISAKNPLVDLFYDIGGKISPGRLKVLLENAWNESPLMTLKIIFNARSIHLGKSNKIALYKAFGWLAENHPATLLANLIWLVRPVIMKKAPKLDKRDNNPTRESDIDLNLVFKSKAETSEGDALAKDFKMLDADKLSPDEKSHASYVRFGLSHGYYKDLLNMIALAANDQLKYNGKPSELLTQVSDQTNGWRERRQWDAVAAKEQRRFNIKQQHERVLQKLEQDSFYRALHLTVARIFAHQLEEDRRLLESGRPSHLKNLSLAAKWAPTHGGFHDRHTFILSSIAEILFPQSTDIIPNAVDRESYLRHAREALRKMYLSPLRKALAVVERNIAANTYGEIKYDRVPSLAMDRYTSLFIRKDKDHFSNYIEKLQSGKSRISGATLLPSKLIAHARRAQGTVPDRETPNYKAVQAILDSSMRRSIFEGQWKTLVQRVRDSGTLSSSIAVCDVSGSMASPEFSDKTVPLDSAIGLSLLVSHVTAPPFGGGIITFSHEPAYVAVGGPQEHRDLVEQVKHIMSMDWQMNTNLVSVFENLILPVAVANKLKQEDMIKQVFVFSDMQFDQAEDNTCRWTTSYQRIRAKYTAAGYDMPKLVFWNLASRSTLKPVTMNDENTVLVSGYSQGMLKVFLDGGSFETQENIANAEEDSMVIVDVKRESSQLSLVKRAISHEAYSMLEVVD